MIQSCIGLLEEMEGGQTTHNSLFIAHQTSHNDQPSVYNISVLTCRQDRRTYGQCTLYSPGAVITRAGPECMKQMCSSVARATRGRG